MRLMRLQYIYILVLVIGVVVVAAVTVEVAAVTVEVAAVTVEVAVWYRGIVTEAWFIYKSTSVL